MSRRGDVVTVRPVLIISFLITMLIIGWLGAMQLGVLSGGLGGSAGTPSAVTVTTTAETQPAGASEPAPASPVDRARGLAIKANERERQMESMMQQ
jgi:hypothetical protein